MGTLLLAGGAEFGGKMAEPDLKAIELAGGFDAPIRILPTAAAPDHNHVRAGNNGVRWFQSLGAKDVASVPLTDKASAGRAEVVDALKRAKLIYLLGGFTHYLGQTLKGSPAWEAALEAWRNGAVLAGSSAGAMVLCEFYTNPESGRVEQGLNLVPNALVLPHHNTFGKGWAVRLLEKAPGVTLLGIDEFTGMLEAGTGRAWAVLGGGSVTLYRSGKREIYPRGESLVLSP
jgi:cyanophycinase